MSEASEAEVGGGMKRGRTDRETCEMNGWGVGTLLRGHEDWANGAGTWTTMRITAIGERGILGVCMRHERTANGVITADHGCADRENSWTLQHREWSPVAPPTTADHQGPPACGTGGE